MTVTDKMSIIVFAKLAPIARYSLNHRGSSKNWLRFHAQFSAPMLSD
jgi:hypothetical protein